MAELAAGAVSSLLVVIHSEARLLGGVRDDVQFIKEEMESMKSFLTHLARWAPPGGEHDEQVRTWMNQVRLLAQDCNNCISLYLYRGNPDIHRARGGLRGYLWWASWLLHKLVAQHRAAKQLRQLKERARDVGERRLRYGVEVPAKSGEGQSPLVAGLAAAASSSLARTSGPGGYATRDHDDEDGDNQLVGHSGRRGFLEPDTLDDYVKAKLCEWIHETPANAGETLSMVLVAPYTYQDLLALVQEILVLPSVVLPSGLGYHRMVLVDIPAVHPDFVPLRPKEVLFYILCKLKEQGKEGKVEEKYLDPLEVYIRRSQRLQIYGEMKSALALLKIEENIKEMMIYEKVDKIKSDIQRRIMWGAKLQVQGEFDQLDLDVLLQLLFQAVATSQQGQGKNKDMHRLPAWDNNNVIVKKLKEHMEAEEKDKKVEEEEEKEDKDEEEEEEEEEEEKEVESQQRKKKSIWIHLEEAQYAHILQKVFPKSNSSSKPLQAQDRSLEKQPTKTTTTRLGEDQMKEMIHSVKEDILRELKEGKYDNSEGSRVYGVSDQNPEIIYEKINQMMDKIRHEFKEQLKIKGLVDEIKHNLNYLPDSNNYESPLFILKVNELMDISTWEDTRNALSLLNCSAGLIMMVTTTKDMQLKDIQLAREYCYPKAEPIAIDYSLAGLYHVRMLQLTSQHKNENYNPQIFHDILYECEPHEFCMKIFTHALYANPNRSNEELLKLHNTLQALPKSFNSITKVMFKFSYNDLPKEYRCLKYLLVEDSDLTITFEHGAACELEKMVLSFSKGSISGVDRLPNLKELELNNSFCGRLLSSFGNVSQIAKLTLRGTLLEQDALQILAKKPNLRCLVLLNESFGGIQNEITLKDEFLRLNHLVVDCSAITKIVFTSGSAPRLEKIVWSSFTSLSGIHKLPSLKELEFIGGQVPDEVREGIEKHKNKLSLKLMGQKL